MPDQYATVEELEQRITQTIEEITEDSQSGVSIPNIQQAAIQIGKSLYPLEMIDKEIKQYMQDHPEEAQKFQLRLENVPRLFRKEIENILLPENVNGWMGDKHAYDGESCQDLLSRLDAPKLREGIEKISESVAYVLELCFIPYSTTTDDIYYLARLAQYEQLGLRPQN